jgi:hypothetical protein
VTAGRWAGGYPEERDITDPRFPLSACAHVEKPA